MNDQEIIVAENKSISRRDLFKLTGSLAASVLLRSERVSAEGGDVKEVLNLDTLAQDESRPEELRGILQTRLLKPSSRLAQRPITPITDFIVNPDGELFLSLNERHKSAKDRLDNGVLRGFALLEAVRADTEAVVERPPQYPWDATPVGQRAQTADLPEPVSDERMVELLKDPSYRIPIAAYEPGEFDPANFKLVHIAPQLGIEVELLDDRPEQQPKIPLYGSFGFTPYVIDHQVLLNGEVKILQGLRLGIYVKDGPYDDQHRMNLHYSAMPYQYFESAGAFISPDMMKYYNEISSPGQGFVNPYWERMLNTPGSVFYPGIASQFIGPLGDSGFYDTAPVLHIVSSKL
ncbi:MAG: hypothetical protein HY428_02765 [Candidatus Levybacteria bacterium]|nr:hypothetical protein [Candidatus Levybacteria bacterium]